MVRIAYAKEAEPPGERAAARWHDKESEDRAESRDGSTANALDGQTGRTPGVRASGTRLYEALVSKHDAFGSFAGGPSKGDLEAILQEEYSHFTMLSSTIEQLGGDPTVVTPSADLHATASHGIVQVIVIRGRPCLQSLEAILIAELADNACWEALIALAEQAGEDPGAAIRAGAGDRARAPDEGARGWPRAKGARHMGSMEGGKPRRADDTAAEYRRACNEPHAAVPYYLPSPLARNEVVVNEGLRVSSSDQACKSKRLSGGVVTL